METVSVKGLITVEYAFFSRSLKRAV